MSESTVVSVCNFDIGPEHKPQLNPAHYLVPAATDDKLGILVITDPLQYIPQLDHKVLVVTVPSNEIAKSVVEDWVNGQLKISGADVRPGIFWVKGEQDSDSIKTDFADELRSAYLSHGKWCRELLKMADDLWTEFRKYRHISTSMINAAKYLNAEREWIKTPEPLDMVKCPACRTILDSDAIICKVCRTVVNKARFSELGLEIAPV